MNPRDQAEAGDGDPTKTVQLDDTYRLGMVRAGESDDSGHHLTKLVAGGLLGRMPCTRWNSDPAMHALRFTYYVTVAAHAAYSRALTEATMGGKEVSPEVVGAEAKAKARMAEARAKLHDATGTIDGGRRRP